MLFSRRITFIILLFLFLQCNEEETAPDKVNILFVGNSLTYVNDLPSLVAEIASMDGVNLKFTTIASPNYSFDDHWAEGTIQKNLKDKHFDFLVGQQGPSALPESQAILKESSMTIAAECRKTNTIFGLYMVWPSLDRDFDRSTCIASYTNAAKASDALLCPAGLAWKLAWEKDAKLPLYGPDNFHPSIHGSTLAAMVVYASIRNRKDVDFINRSKASWGSSITDEQLSIMKEATKLAIQTK